MLDHHNNGMMPVPHNNDMMLDLIVVWC
jgi:hypothetical protein